MTRDFEVHIEVGGGEPIPMADVQVDERGPRTVRTEFSYRSSYLARTEKPMLDPATRFDGARHVSEALPRGLADAGPDDWGRTLALRAHRRALSETEFLLAADDLTRIGALRLRVDPSGPFLAIGHEVPPLVELDELAAAARAVETEPDDLAAVRRLLRAGTGSLGGARPKASVADGGRLMIAKFAARRDEIDVMAWEKVCLDLAEIAGIQVPANRLVPVGNTRALLLDRFDRDSIGHRVPYLSAFALGDAPDPAAGDYLEIGETLADLDIADLPGTLRALWRRAAFNIAMRNTDDHLKNHGVCWSNTGWRLSPAFDITPDPVVGSTRTTLIDGEDHPARESSALIGLAEEFGITPPEQRRVLSEVLAAAGQWRTRAVQLGIEETEIVRVGRIISEAQGRLAAVLDGS